MGEFVNSRLTQTVGWILAAVIIALNVKVVFDSLVPEPIRKTFYHAFGLPVSSS
jgi:hypothetical protein